MCHFAETGFRVPSRHMSGEPPTLRDALTRDESCTLLAVPEGDIIRVIRSAV